MSTKRLLKKKKLVDNEINKRVLIGTDINVINSTVSQQPLNTITNSPRIVTRSQHREIIANKITEQQKVPVTKMNVKKANKRKPNNNSTNEPEKSSNLKSSDEQQQMLVTYQNIENELYLHYKNIVKRLNLKFTPYCVKNIEYCRLNHSKKCPRPEKIDFYKSSRAECLATGNRPMQFLKFIENLCLRKEFPGENSIKLILDLILIINPNQSDECTAKMIIEKCIYVFENVLLTFPPCWHDIQESYKTMLTTIIKVEKYIPNKTSSNENLLTFIIGMLKEIMSEISTNDKKSTTTNDYEMNDSAFFNFQQWESENCTNYRFDKLERTEKLDRLFYTLDLLTKLLERDLSIWMLRYLTKTDQHMYSQNKPLVAVLFFDETYNQITNLVKKTLAVFINCACLNYPPNKIDILSRLVGLLSAAINLHEKSDDDKIMYPNIGYKTETFAKEIFKIFESIFGRRVEIFLLVIKHIKIPYIKYLVINNFLYLMDPDRGEMCPEKVYANFVKKRWLQCSSDVRHFYNEGLIENPNVKYPIPLKSQLNFRPKESHIYRNEYIDLLFNALKSYCDTFHIIEIGKIFMNNKESPIKTRNPRKLSRSRSKDLNDDTTLDLDLLENDIEILEKNLNLKQKCSTIETEIVTNPYRMHVDSEIILKYRNDIKYLMILKKMIAALKTVHGEIFDHWSEFLENIFKELS